MLPVSDAAGEIVAVGSRVQNWSTGQRVCINFSLNHIDGDPAPEQVPKHLGGPETEGVLTEYKVVPAHSLVAIPDYMSYEEASTLPCAAVTAYNGLYGPKPLRGGDFVLILGTGGVSMYNECSLLQLASPDMLACIIALESRLPSPPVLLLLPHHPQRRNSLLRRNSEHTMSSTIASRRTGTRRSSKSLTGEASTTSSKLADWALCPSRLSL